MRLSWAHTTQNLTLSAMSWYYNKIQRGDIVMKAKKEQRVTISKIMTPVVMTLFLVVVLFLVNFQSFCHLFNRNSYECVTATLVQNTSDPLTMMVPMVRIQYDYQGTTYEDKKYYVLASLFGLTKEEGSELEIYVNKAAPGHSLLKENFFKNIVNWILLLFGGVFVSLLVRRIRQGFRNQKKRRLRRKTKRNQGTGGNKDE